MMGHHQLDQVLASEGGRRAYSRLIRLIRPVRPALVNVRQRVSSSVKDFFSSLIVNYASLSRVAKCPARRRYCHLAGRSGAPACSAALSASHRLWQLGRSASYHLWNCHEPTVPPPAIPCRSTVDYERSIAMSRSWRKTRGESPWPAPHSPLEG